MTIPPTPTSGAPVGFGVIGANSTVATAAVLPAIDAARNALLVATASRSRPVPDRWASTAVHDYDDVLNHPDVEAVYIPLPNGLHAEWTERAAAAGKHVLCEKPLASDSPTAQSMADVCATAGVLLAEAWMTPFDRRWSAAIEQIRNGAIGAVEVQDHRFTFTIGPESADNYRWDPAQGGGALLDVGIYCVGTATELWGTDCSVESVVRIRAETGVDARTSVRLRWPGGRVAEMDCSFVDAERQTARFQGTEGDLVLEHAAFTSGHPDDDIIRHRSQAGAIEEHSVAPGDPYQTMIEAFGDAVRSTAKWPRPVERAVELLALLDRIASTDASS